MLACLRARELEPVSTLDRGQAGLRSVGSSPPLPGLSLCSHHTCLEHRSFAEGSAMSRPVPHPSSAQLLTGTVAKEAIQSAVEAWEPEYAVLTDWLLMHPEPVRSGREHERWRRQHEHLKAFVRPSEQALLNVVRASDHKARIGALRTAIHCAEARRDIMWVETELQREERERERARRREMGMPDMGQLSLAQGPGRDQALALATSRWHVAWRLVELLEPFGTQNQEAGLFQLSLTLCFDRLNPSWGQVATEKPDLDGRGMIDGSVTSQSNRPQCKRRISFVPVAGWQERVGSAPEESRDETREGIQTLRD